MLYVKLQLQSVICQDSFEFTFHQVNHNVQDSLITSSDINISQGSVATCLGCGDHSIANFPESVPVKEF